MAERCRVRFVALDGGDVSSLQARVDQDNARRDEYDYESACHFCNAWNDAEFNITGNRKIVAIAERAE